MIKIINDPLLNFNSKNKKQANHFLATANQAKVAEQE